MPEVINKTADVFGVSRELPLTYVEREHVDNKLLDNLTRDKHIIIYGSSKQGKTCLRKHCLQDDDYIHVQCQKHIGYFEAKRTDSKSGGLRSRGYALQDDRWKVEAASQSKGWLQIIWHRLRIGRRFGGERGSSETRTYEPLQLDASDPNDLVRALKAIEFSKFIVLEDFHYLPQEAQEQFAFALETIHEASKITFIIVAVWREEKRLIVYNGDLAGRVISVDADLWSTDSLLKVSSEGFIKCSVSHVFQIRAN
jgi:hypothetical protein